MGVKLGQKWAIKDGNLLASNQVGSRFFNKEFDFSRTTSGTYIDKDGVLQTAELYNLVTYSEDFSQWTLSNTSVTSGQIGYDGTDKAWLLESATDGNARRIQQSVSTSGEQTFSLYAKKGSVNFLIIYANGVAGRFFDLNNGTIGAGFGGTPDNSQITEISNGWYRCSITINASSTAMLVYPIATNGSLVTSAGDNIYIQNAQINQGTQPLAYQYTNGLQGLPRISYENGVGHLLLEPQRSNLLLQSNSFDTSWAALSTGSVVGGQSGVYGSNDAWELTSTSSGGNVYQANSNSGTQTFSVYAKGDGSTGIRLYAFGSVNANAYFNLSTGVVLGASNTLASSIENVGGGWYRCSISFNQTNTGLRFYTSNNSTSLAAGTIYIQHAQLESGSYPTSIIETTTTQVTRNADVCNNSGSAQDFNSEEGVLYVELKLDTNALQNQYSMISIGDALNNRVQLTFIQNSNDFSAIVGSSIGTRELLFPFNYGSYNKIALKYDSSGFKVFHNGVFVGNNTYAISGLDLQTLQFRFPTGTQYDFYGKVRNLQVFTEALSDEELQQLTT